MFARTHRHSELADLQKRLMENDHHPVECVAAIVLKETSVLAELRRSTKKMGRQDE
jgi:hypothetical protein